MVDESNEANEVNVSAATTVMCYGKLLVHMSEHLISASKMVSMVSPNTSASMATGMCATLLGTIGKHMVEADLGSLARLAAAMQRQIRAKIGSGELNDNERFLREMLPMSAAALDQFATEIDKDNA